MVPSPEVTDHMLSAFCLLFHGYFFEPVGKYAYRQHYLGSWIYVSELPFINRYKNAESTRYTINIARIVDAVQVTV